MVSKYVYVLVQLEDTVNEDILASFCICPESTLLLCIPQFVHFLIAVESYLQTKPIN